MTHRSYMSEEGIQLLVGVEDAILREVIGRLDWAYALAPCLLVDRLGAAIRRYRYIVHPVRGHCHLRYQSLQYRIPTGVPGRQSVTPMCQPVISVLQERTSVHKIAVQLPCNSSAPIRRTGQSEAVRCACA